MQNAITFQNSYIKSISKFAGNFINSIIIVILFLGLDIGYHFQCALRSIRYLTNLIAHSIYRISNSVCYGVIIFKTLKYSHISFRTTCNYMSENKGLAHFRIEIDCHYKCAKYCTWINCGLVRSLGVLPTCILVLCN